MHWSSTPSLRFSPFYLTPCFLLHMAISSLTIGLYLFAFYLNLPLITSLLISYSVCPPYTNFSLSSPLNIYLLTPISPSSPPPPPLSLLLLSVHSKLSVDVVGGRIPLFSVDLKVAEATVDSPAKFVYSAPGDSIFNSVMSHFDKTFEVLKGKYLCFKY
jgi:hypothetical protein